MIADMPMCRVPGCGTRAPFTLRTMTTNRHRTRRWLGREFHLCQDHGDAEIARLKSTPLPGLPCRTPCEWLRGLFAGGT